VLYALSGGLLLFVLILTSIAQLQSNKFEQRGLETILTYSFPLGLTLLAYLLSYWRRISHDLSKLHVFLYLIYTSLSMVHSTHVFHKASPLCFDQTSPTKGYGFGTLAMIWTFHSSFSLSIYLLSLKLLVYYKVLLHHAKILRWI
jgi:hypothetical protein